jgi:hypothetical protein
MAPIRWTQLSYGPHTSHAAPIWCHLPPMGYAGPIQLTWLPYSRCSSNLAPSASHLEHIAPIWLPYGTCGSHMVHAAPLWHHPPPIWLHLAPIWWRLLHTVPINQSNSMTYMAPMKWMRLSYSDIRLTYGAHSSHMAQCGACGSYMAHAVPSGAWSSYMAAYSSHMAPSGSGMAHVAPIHHAPLPYGPI